MRCRFRTLVWATRKTLVMLYPRFGPARPLSLTGCRGRRRSCSRTPSRLLGDDGQWAFLIATYGRRDQAPFSTSRGVQHDFFAAGPAVRQQQAALNADVVRRRALP
jgi:hypothetical protein